MVQQAHVGHLCGPMLQRMGPGCEVRASCPSTAHKRTHALSMHLDWRHAYLLGVLSRQGIGWMLHEPSGPTWEEGPKPVLVQLLPHSPAPAGKPGLILVPVVAGEEQMEGRRCFLQPLPVSRVLMSRWPDTQAHSGGQGDSHEHRVGDRQRYASVLTTRGGFAGAPFNCSPKHMCPIRLRTHRSALRNPTKRVLYWKSV